MYDGSGCSERKVDIVLKGILDVGGIKIDSYIRHDHEFVMMCKNKLNYLNAPIGSNFLTVEDMQNLNAIFKRHRMKKPEKPKKIQHQLSNTFS